MAENEEINGVNPVKGYQTVTWMSVGMHGGASHGRPASSAPDQASHQSPAMCGEVASLRVELVTHVCLHACVGGWVGQGIASDEDHGTYVRRSWSIAASPFACTHVSEVCDECEQGLVISRAHVCWVVRMAKEPGADGRHKSGRALAGDTWTAIRTALVGQA